MKNYLIETQSVFVNSDQDRLGMKKPEEIWMRCLVDLNPEKIMLIRPCVDDDGEMIKTETSILYNSGSYITIKENIQSVINLIKSFNNAN